jgi:shikimate dehydrogenase
MKRFAVIGDPIAHSRSPRMHQAAYHVLGLPHTYAALRVTPTELRAVVADLREGRLDGCNVTLPHKVHVLEHVDRVAPSAAAFGAANTLVRDRHGAVVAHNTDIPALAAELADVDPRGTAIVLGSGGAARAAVAALCMHRVRRIVVRSRSPIVLPPGILVQQEAMACGAAERKASVIVQATSLGLDPARPDAAIPAHAIDWAHVPASAFALDLVYSPSITPFLEAASGHRAANGLGMLARQGALAFELWLGVRAPLYTMWSALS